MKYIYFFLPFLLVSCKTVTNTSKTTSEDKTEIAKPITISYKVNSEEVTSFLKELSSDEMEGRETGEAGMVKAADFLIDFLKANQIKPYFKTYQDTLSTFKMPAYNVVGFIEGTDPVLKKEFIILSAHYDHIGINKNTPNEDKINNGANDDASGVTAVAQMVKYFSQTKSNKRSVLVVFFAGEEKGLLGSKHLSEKLHQQNFNLYTQLNVEMIGIPMKRDFLAYLTGFELSNMAKKINEYSGKNTVGFLPKAGEFQLFKRSDNFPFFKEFNVPCQSISTFDFENFDYYHHVKDEFQLMDTTHMTNLIQEFLSVITLMTNSAKKEIKMNAK
ncbi:M20/M25/M40 family metallo-hydrolase [Flavobacterium agrisoli]|uniref:M20/M25/M40 family metallo-hydrolase n=1 Tax=Flavobacterium agrisoli TaxID=2793066 RepID=A0A934PQ34_9FLAO|nr:M20/M25/M40 family metallo-hydrolase [Flavobacterium agrisoli]MBK0370543.1 M20/M25/M40 family metallo-hydrolase [Flavobacterium agrisoli]